MLIVSLYTTRVLLKTLGVEDYGVYNVVAGFVSLFGFLNATLSSSMQRFYNYELGRNGEDGVAKVYVTGFYVHLIIAGVVFVLLESLGLWYVNHIMVLPEDRIIAANVLFQATIFSMVLIIMQIPFSGVIMAYEKMNFYAFVGVLDVVLKLCIVIVLPYIPYDKLIVYSILLTVISTINFLLYCSFSKLNLIRNVSINRKDFDKIMLKKMASFSGWNLMGTFAYMLRGQGVNMTLNYFFGPVINAARGVAFQVNSGVMGFSRNIVTAFSPQLTSSFASGNIRRSIRLMFVESKVCFALVATLITPLILEMNQVLTLWLGKTVPQYTRLFTILVLVDSLICVLNTPCTQMVFASGKLKNYQIASSIINILLIPSACILLLFDKNPVKVFYLTILFSIINQIVCLFFSNRIVHFGLRKYVKEVLLPCMFFALLLPIIPVFVRLFISESIIRLVIVCLITFMVAAIMAFFLILNGSERRLIINHVKQKPQCQK